MASEDVIELGSSDDEAEPAPKKVKPGPNAMVHIPTKLPGLVIKPKLPGLTIKPTKSKVPVIKEIMGKPITVTKIPYVSKTKPNGRTVRNTTIIPTIRKELQNPRSPSTVRTTINPMNLMKKLANTQIKINKVPSNTRPLKTPIKVLNPKPLTNLPPSITVTKTSAGLKRPAATNISNMRKVQKMNPKNVIGEVLTVELDDDEGSETSNAGPQWYLRPEQQQEMQTEKEDLQKKNNEEPESSKLIEITIEDSPVKPVQSKRTCEVGNELSITIEDSPVKVATENVLTKADSDNENTKIIKEPQSKKKLEYPKESSATGTIEIEIEPMEIEFCAAEMSSTTNEQNVTIVNEVAEKQDLPVKKTEFPLLSTSKKEEKKPKDIEPVVLTEQKDSEFHPVYQNFIDLCFKLENSDDMKKIVEKKIKAYYKQVPKEYTESEEFIDMVSSKILSMKAGPEKMYLFIKDIVDELNLQRKMAKSQVLNKEIKKTEPEKFLYGEESEFDSKRQRQIRKLEKTLKKLHRAIQKLEEQEVDFDDEEDSVYLLTERYKERMVRVHAKFCQLTNTKMPSEPRVQIEARPGQPTGPAKRLEKWVNKKVPIGTPLPFPDFHDVLRCVREANEEDKLGWNEADIMEEARDLFTRCGKKLQRRRQENEWRLAASRISIDLDPADESEGLKKKLEENKQLATKKETDVFNKYADRQSQLKLEAEEIEDKEAEESPIESEEDEGVEETSALENKEKRKERLRRLIQKKSKKIVDNVEESKELEVDQSVNQKSEEADKNDSTIKQSETEEIEKGNTKINVATVSDINNENPTQLKEIEEIHSNTDNSDKVESDIDELHLLQKLHSGNEIDSSTLESSDTDTPIDIFSDTLQSSSDNKANQASDVISIENSSFSESEATDKIHSNNEISNPKTSEINSTEVCESTKNIVDAIVEVECAPLHAKQKTAQTNNEEYTDFVGNILLASSDDEVCENKEVNQASDGGCVNIKDDAISIGDTMVQDVDFQQNETNTENIDTSSRPLEIECEINLTDNNLTACADNVSKDTEIKETINLTSAENSQDNTVSTAEESSNTVPGDKSGQELIQKEIDLLPNTSISLEDNATSIALQGKESNSDNMSKNLNYSNDGAESMNKNPNETDIASIDSVDQLMNKSDSKSVESVQFEEDKVMKSSIESADISPCKASDDINNQKIIKIDIPATKESVEKVEANMEIECIASDDFFVNDSTQVTNDQSDSLDIMLEEFRSDLESKDNFSSTSSVNNTA